MKLNMTSFASVQEAVDAMNEMTDDMGPFGLISMGADEPGEGVNVEEGMGPEIPGEAMADMEEFYPEEEVYS